MSDVAEGPETNVTGRRSSPQARREPPHRRRDAVDDLRLLDDAEVQVGDERQRAAALARAGVEDERAGLGDRERAAGDGGADLVQLADARPTSVDRLETVEAAIARAGRPAPRPARRRPPRQASAIAAATSRRRHHVTPAP